MLIRKCVTVIGAAVVLFTAGGPAFASSSDQDLLGGYGDNSAPLVNNVTIAPVQLCGSGVAVGLLRGPADQHTGSCTNAPTGDPLQELITNSTLG
ncbi:hypothetical protein ACFQ1S_07575 [Kibdelosporangium lantanae]|uniref:DUF320 domain-containing protein n=1 Tax=Kibdelosporangium lantanae TaxID=1497396 RepID=A0ABW3M762_9PSEU